MDIDLKFQLPAEALSRLLARDLATLHHDIDLPDAEEAASATCEFLTDAGAVLDRLQCGHAARRRVVVVVSPGLVDQDADGARSSAFAKRLLQESWDRRIILGLIGVLRGPDRRVPGLDCVLAEDSITAPCLRGALHKVLRRLWYKLPPVKHPGQGQGSDGFRIAQVTSKEQFRQSLGLRHRVYSALGYIDPRIADAPIALEFDGYDPAAVHFNVTLGESPERIAGTMRIIVPGRRALPQLSCLRHVSYQSWCEQFANEEESRVFRDLLNRPVMNALPILDSFDYFANAGEQRVLRDMVFPTHSCEVSRIVVHPDYRGCGILDLLMKKAIDVATHMGKRYLLLECAPFHEQMYRKYGFRVVEDAGRGRYYARAQRLDSWAIAMHRKLRQEHGEGVSPTALIRLDSCELHIKEAPHESFTLSVACDQEAANDAALRLRQPYRLHAGHHPPAGYARKSADASLRSLLLLAFERLDRDLDEVVQELFRRLPGAHVRLERDGCNVFEIDRTTCVPPAGGPALHRRVHHWMENCRGSA